MGLSPSLFASQLSFQLSTLSSLIISGHKDDIVGSKIEISPQMSRAHMLYDDKAINKVVKVKWKGIWQEEVVFRFAQKPGAIVEGRVKEKTRLVVSDESGSATALHHYNAVQIELEKGFKRTFDGCGGEIEPWKNSTKKINTGHLMSSYKTVDVETSALTSEEVKELVKVPELDVHLPGILKSSNTVVLFYCETSLKNLEVNSGDYVRTKTKGNGPYVEYLAKVDQGNILHTINTVQYNISWSFRPQLAGLWTTCVKISQPITGLLSNNPVTGLVK